MKTRSKTVELVKDGQFDKATLQGQLERIIKKGISPTLYKQGWTFVPPEFIDSMNSTIAKIRLYKKMKREREGSDEVFARQSDEVVQRMAMYCSESNWCFKDAAIENKVSPKQKFDFPMPEEIQPFFGHIYDRDSQIRIINSSLKAAQASGFEQRNHCLLWGKPGCAKTEALLGFEKMVGSHNVTKLDATSTTKAGAENLLLELDVVPPILLIEELEKCNPLNLPWLLGVLDQRGEIIKTNARIGSQRKSAKCLCVATVNNLDELTRMMSGALASRFQHKIYFPRPNRTILEKILMREIIKVNGSETWIGPILDYVLNIEKVNDPRRAISLLDGREKWLTNEYKDDLMAIREAMATDNVELPDN
jgi:hypothetical protein